MTKTKEKSLPYQQHCKNDSNHYRNKLKTIFKIKTLLKIKSLLKTKPLPKQTQNHCQNNLMRPNFLKQSDCHNKQKKFAKMNKTLPNKKK